MVEAAFDYLPSAEDRAYFNSLPTSFDLDDEAVERLMSAGRQLLRDDPEFQALLAELAAPAPAPPTPQEEGASR
jgi:hypothetical protein